MSAAVNLLLLGRRDPAAEAANSYFARAEALGGSYDLTAINGTYTVAYTKAAWTTYITGLFAAGIWPQITDMQAYMGMTFAGIPAKIKHSGVPLATVNNYVIGDHAAGGAVLGLAGGATTGLSGKYCDLLAKLFDISADGKNLHLALFASTNLQNGRPMGVFRNSSYLRHYLVGEISGTGFAWGQNGGTSFGPKGFLIATREGSGAAYSNFNGVDVGSIAVPNETPPSEWSTTIGQSHGSNTGLAAEPELFFGASSARVCIASQGYGLSAAHRAAYNTLTQNLMLAFGYVP